eukprot:TRINITY_DN3899_c0_g2_i1.p1 TRINITY_DN3899_c0_g2~~TRINITY_DN3899_c0_g2_i1.p1  ORF type:complete len:249 (+),score=42.71 TRINITY_DN3899_c0_g2_i1:70-747(+)
MCYTIAEDLTRNGFDIISNVTTLPGTYNDSDPIVKKNISETIEETIRKIGSKEPDVILACPFSLNHNLEILRYMKHKNFNTKCYFTIYAPSESNKTDEIFEYASGVTTESNSLKYPAEEFYGTYKSIYEIYAKESGGYLLTYSSTGVLLYGQMIVQVLKEIGSTNSTLIFEAFGSHFEKLRLNTIVGRFSFGVDHEPKRDPIIVQILNRAQKVVGPFATQIEPFV